MAIQERIKEQLAYTTESSGTFEIGKGSDADFASSMAAKAMCLIDDGKIKDAEKCVRAGLQRSPEHPGCLSSLAVCLAVGDKNFKEAENIARKIIATDPANGSAYYVLGRLSLEGERRKSAFRYFERSRTVAPDNVALEQDIERIEPRRKPVIGFLPRNHFLNYILGWLRARLMPTRMK